MKVASFRTGQARLLRYRCARGRNWWLKNHKKETNLKKVFPAPAINNLFSIKALRRWQLIIILDNLRIPYPHISRDFGTVFWIQSLTSGMSKIHSPVSFFLLLLISRCLSLHTPGYSQSRASLRFLSVHTKRCISRGPNLLRGDSYHYFACRTLSSWL